MRHTAIAASVIALGPLMGPVAMAQAHHAVNAQFDVTKTMTIKGEFTKVDWQNPHAWFHFVVTEIDGVPLPEGEFQHWATVTVGPKGLRRLGVSDRRMFTPGDVILVKLNPDRSGKLLGFTNSFTFEDGRHVVISYVDQFGNDAESREYAN